MCLQLDADRSWEKFSTQKVHELGKNSYWGLLGDNWGPKWVVKTQYKRSVGKVSTYAV